MNDEQIKTDYEKLLFEQIKQLSEKLDKPKTKIDEDYCERIAELEVKMSKLWSLLVNTNNLKKEERLTPMGKQFGSVLLKK